MHPALDEIYRHAAFTWLFAGLLAANVAAVTQILFSRAVRRREADFGALVYFQRSGLWLAAWLGLVAATLPAHLPVVFAVVALVLAIHAVAVLRIERRA